MLCHNLENHWNDFDHILYWRSLLVHPTYFMLFVRENQMLLFMNLKCVGNARVDTSELLSYVYIS
jgi:hypothetical protein